MCIRDRLLLVVNYIYRDLWQVELRRAIAVSYTHLDVYKRQAYRYWRIANDPLSRLVDIAPRGEVHNGVSSPADSPDRLLDLSLIHI